MIKKICYSVVIIITAFFIYLLFIKNNVDQKGNTKSTIETRGIFISYIEYMKYFQSKDPNEIRKEINKMIEVIKKNHLTCIYLQVRAFSDSIYYSNIFPFSHTITGIQGDRAPLDILEHFIQVAHQNGLKIHAWVNPYRVSNQTDASFLSSTNPAYKWLNTNHVKIIKNKGIFYNPASDPVKKLIVQGIKEIITNYEVDGILLDDYFYPDCTIDLEDYKKVENTISITDFRLSQVNELISNIYQIIKEKDKNILFGISPDGNIENNYTTHYADIKKWLKEDGYIDYIMPQIYYGFLHDTKPFIRTVNEWKELVHNNTKLVIALSLYKAGVQDLYAGNTKNEWIDSSDIIKKQIQVIRQISNYSGFSLFRYSFLLDNQTNSNLQKEIKNYNSLFV